MSTDPGPSYADTTDFDDVDRGFVATRTDPVITAADGHHTGDAGLVATLLGLLDGVDHQFPIVTP